LQVDLLGRYSNLLPWSEGVRRFGQLSESHGGDVEPPPSPKPPLKRLNAEQIRILVERYQQGRTTYEIAHQFGIHRVTVSQHLHRSGVTMRRQGLSDDVLHEAARLYEAGSSLARVADQFGVDPKTIWSGLSRMGLMTRDSHGRDREL
jgi:transposase-like protein